MSHFSAQMSTEESESLRRQAHHALGGGRIADGIALLEKAHALNPASADICNDLARALARSGHYAEAEQWFLKAVSAAPDDAFFLNSYGVYLIHENRLDEASVILERALSLKPGHHEIANNLGLLQHRRGDWAAAEDYFQQAIRANPSWPAAHGNLAVLLRDMKQYDRAEASYREALKYAPGNIGGWHVLSEFYRSLGRYDDAVGILKRIMSQTPFNERAWLPILDLQENMSRLDDAAATLAEIKTRFPRSTAAAVMEAKLLRRTGKTSEAITLLEDLGALTEASSQYLARLFELGQLYDRAGDADKAFACFSEAKTAQAHSPEARGLEQDQYIDTVVRIRHDFTPQLASAIASASHATGAPAPVFLVGFPRSGTTLLDQILSSHPDVRVAEEEPVTNRLTMHLIRKFGGKPPSGAEARGSLPDWLLNNPFYPACLADMTDDDAAELRRLFYAGHGVAEGASKVFVDKLPLNIRHAGLLHRVFPDAKFILALRHPCDSVLSCFMQQFALNPAMMPFLKLDSTARLYDEIFRLWNVYAQALPLKSHAIRYEDVVADFQPTVAALLHFLGLEWNDAVLEYDKTARARNISTPSYHQVTEKIYTRASGRWQRYRAHLEPVMPLLEPHAKKHGYSMDVAEDT